VTHAVLQNQSVTRPINGSLAFICFTHLKLCYIKKRNYHRNFNVFNHIMTIILNLDSTACTGSISSPYVKLKYGMHNRRGKCLENDLRYKIGKFWVENTSKPRASKKDVKWAQ
jgi:hypothetical protein